VAFTEDFTPFLNADEFAVDATVGGVALRGIFDAAYADALGMGGTSPALLIATADAPAAAQGAAVVIGATSYTVANPEPDGTGMTLLRLQEA